jgi:hypothetical protein
MIGSQNQVMGTNTARSSVGSLITSEVAISGPNNAQETACTGPQAASVPLEAGSVAKTGLSDGHIITHAAEGGGSRRAFYR